MNLRERYLFYSRLSVLLQADLPLDRALDLLKGRVAGPPSEEAITNLGRAVTEGKPLSRAMSEAGDAFPRLDSEIVATGESGGSLVETLAGLAKHLERSYRNRLELRAQNFYLVALFVIGLIAYGALIFTQLGYDDNALSMMAGGAGRHSPHLTIYFFMRAFPALFVWATLVILLSYAIIKLYLPGLIDWALMRFPWLDRRAALTDLVAFSRSMALGLNAEIALPKCVALSAGAVHNQALGRSLARLEILLVEGGELGSVLALVKGLPPAVSDLAEFGEEQGDLAELFEAAAEEMEPGLKGHNQAQALLVIFAIFSVPIGFWLFSFFLKMIWWY